MSDAAAGADAALPTRGAPDDTARCRLGAAEPVQLGLQQYPDHRCLALAALIVPPLFRWAVTHATISGTTRAACTGDGACWTFIRVRFPRFFYGNYPSDQYWRADVVFALLVAFCAPVLRDGTRHRWTVGVAAARSCFLHSRRSCCGGGVFGLSYVDTSLWGGLMLDMIVSFVTVAGSLPLGILLAFGRRSQLPVVRMLSVGYIELWRGVPLLTVLFMSAVVMPLFLPEGVSADRLLRAMAALVLFNAAYMAEVVRGGLQGVASGPGGSRRFARPALVARAGVHRVAAGACASSCRVSSTPSSTCSRTPRW